ncbi:MAG: hypothetical protein AAF211_32410 [Myxococcota bacterium]
MRWIGMLVLVNCSSVAVVRSGPLCGYDLPGRLAWDERAHRLAELAGQLERGLERPPANTRPERMMRLADTFDAWSRIAVYPEWFTYIDVRGVDEPRPDDFRATLRAKARALWIEVSRRHPEHAAEARRRLWGVHPAR